MELISNKKGIDKVSVDIRVNFGDIGGLGWVVESYVATLEGLDAVKKYLTSPEGSAMLQKFVGTPEGKETIVSILPHIFLRQTICDGA
jgi:hypothetical protein